MVILSKYAATQIYVRNNLEVNYKDCERPNGGK